MKKIFIYCCICIVFILSGNNLCLAQKGSLKKARKYLKPFWMNMQFFDKTSSESCLQFEKAIEEYKKCINSEIKKIDEAYQELGVLLYTGPEYLKNYDEAIHYLETSQKIFADKKQTLARKQLQASCFNHIGNIYCIKEDFKTAFTYYEKAANLAPYYNSNLAKMYWLGLGVEQDFNIAKTLYREASKAGNLNWNKLYAIDYQKTNEDDSTISTYLEYIYSTSINESSNTWMSLLVKAADMNYPPAQIDLWNIKYKYSEEPDKGLHYLEKAIAQNYIPAITEFGSSFIKFNGISYKISNFSEAEKWLKQAAIEGDPLAQFNLGLTYYYQNGNFLPSSEYLNTALFWFTESNKQGVMGSQYFIDVIKNGLSAKSQGQNFLTDLIKIKETQKSTNQTTNKSNKSNFKPNSRAISTTNSTNSREYEYYSSTICYKGEENSNLYIYRNQFEYRASWVFDKKGLEKAATMPIHIGGLSINGEQLSCYVLNFGVPWYFNYNK